MAAITTGILVVCVGAAMLIAWGSQLPVMTAFLSLALGGMTEMGLISKTFGLGAPIVTSFHLVRILCTIFLTNPCHECCWPEVWCGRNRLENEKRADHSNTIPRSLTTLAHSAIC